MPIPHPALQRPVRSPEELTAHWELVAALGGDPDHLDDPHDPLALPGDGADLWIQVFDVTGRACGVLVVVEGVEQTPDDELTGHLAGVLTHLLTLEAGGAGAVAVAVVPWAPREVAVGDLAWADALVRAGRTEGVALLGVHLVSGVRAPACCDGERAGPGEGLGAARGVSRRERAPGPGAVAAARRAGGRPPAASSR